MKLFNVGRFVIAAGCLYEITAIPHRTPFPTITAIIHWSQKHRAGKAFLCAWIAVWAHHFVKVEHYRQTKA